MAYGDLNNLSRKTASDKVLRDKAFNIAKTQKYYGYINVDLLQWFLMFLIKSLLVVLLHVPTQRP